MGRIITGSALVRSGLGGVLVPRERPRPALPAAVLDPPVEAASAAIYDVRIGKRLPPPEPAVEVHPDVLIADGDVGEGDRK